VYVKTVTLRGFKSFASATTLRLEPGITCIVGPNGSGKSNVVDAMSWVMGEQGAKTLRGGKMEDVIFAGTSGRAPLGRAEVALTIDNTDGALPIDFSEVTIRRTMFRGGGSEYAINGTQCRLLDIQELLSDSGIGREMHVVVGQGQLDTILRATPEERRGLIEEAAGVLKHRKRKERALRKLETMDANLTRVHDLVGEIRRQLGPLGRQAETARKAAFIQAEVRDARLRIMADDLVALTAELDREVADETALLARRAEVEQALAGRTERLDVLERETHEARPRMQRDQERWFGLTRLVERLTATAALADRVRLLSEEDADADRPGEGPARDPELLRAQANELRERHRELVVEIESATAALTAATAERADAENRYAVEQRRLAELTRAAADRREGLATLAGRVAALASRVEAGEAEIGRLRDTAAAARQRALVAEREFASLESTIAVDEEGEEDLDAQHEAAAAEAESLRAQLSGVRDDEAAADRERQAALAKAQALELSLSRKDGAGTLLEPGVVGSGVVGALAGLLDVEHGYEPALAAALGWAADAVVVDSMDAAARGLAALRERDAGRAAMLVAEAGHAGSQGARPDLPDGARWAADLVTCPEDIRPAVRRLLDGVAVVEGDAAALELTARHTGVTAVTVAGDVFAPGLVRGGSASAPSLLEVRSALDDAQAVAAAATRRVEQARFAAAALGERIAAAQERAEAALERLHESDARMAAVAERLGHLGSVVRSAHAEAERTDRAIEAASVALDADRGSHGALAARLDGVDGQADEGDPSPALRDELEELAGRARGRETDARLTLRTQEERARAVQERAEALDAAAAAELAARERQALRRERRRREATVAVAVNAGAAYAAERIRATAVVADERRRAGERAEEARDLELTTVRREVGQLQEQLRELTDSVHRDEVARAEQRLRIETLQVKALEELGVDPQTLVEAFGPHLPIPVLATADDPAQVPVPAEPVPFVRDEQERRLRAAERRLGALGRVNPLALEEYAALEERHAFLVAQVEDLKTSRRDLLGIVRDVDERVEQAFAEAFADTAREFEAVFPRLFPGGEGRLVLTDPESLLTTGLEVEARPPGKKIKRLSLLSGGERSLVAVALLVAIFKARPSPFYVMDEVEAALDDANLARLLILFEELRDSSQLIVITHQKKTMEIADALYGVSMRGDGVTTVVSQRMRDVAVSA
jgi:chromosome segregation protein